MSPLEISIGFCVGVLVGLTGVGGGALMTPILVLGLGVPTTVAIGTDLLYAAITKSVGAIVHGWQKNVCWRTVSSLALGSIPGALVSGFIFVKLHSIFGKEIESVTGSVLGGALIFTAIAIVFTQKGTGAAAENLPCISPPKGKISPRIQLALIGFFVGSIVTFTSVGSGALIAGALFALFPALGTTKIIGSDITHAALLLTVAAGGHSVMGHVDTELVASLLVGSIPGVIIGSRMIGIISEKTLKLAISGMIAFAGFKLL